MGYSIKHKMLVLQKVLPPRNRPVHEVSKETGISVLDYTDFGGHGVLS